MTQPRRWEGLNKSMFSEPEHQCCNWPRFCPYILCLQRSILHIYKQKNKTAGEEWVVALGKWIFCLTTLSRLFMPLLPSSLHSFLPILLPDVFTTLLQILSLLSLASPSPPWSPPWSLRASPLFTLDWRTPRVAGCSVLGAVCCLLSLIFLRFSSATTSPPLHSLCLSCVSQTNNNFQTWETKRSRGHQSCCTHIL